MCVCVYVWSGQPGLRHRLDGGSRETHNVEWIEQQLGARMCACVSAPQFVACPPPISHAQTHLQLTQHTWHCIISDAAWEQRLPGVACCNAHNLAALSQVLVVLHEMKVIYYGERNAYACEQGTADGLACT